MTVKPYPYPSSAADHDAWVRHAIHEAGLLLIDTQDATYVRMLVDHLHHTQPGLRVALTCHASDAVTLAATELGMVSGAAYLGEMIGIGGPQAMEELRVVIAAAQPHAKSVSEMERYLERDDDTPA